MRRGSSSGAMSQHVGEVDGTVRELNHASGLLAQQMQFRHTAVLNTLERVQRTRLRCASKSPIAVPSLGILGALGVVMINAADHPRAINCTVFHGPANGPGAFLPSPPSSAGEGGSSDFKHAPYGGRGAGTSWRPAGELFARRGVPKRPTVLIIDATMLERVGELRDLPGHVVIVAADEQTETALGKRADISLVGSPGATGRRCMLRAACLLSDARLRIRRERRRILRTRRELYELNRIGMALMLERDENALLHQILAAGKRFTESDAGCLLLLETDEQGARRVRLALCQADSVPQVRALTPETIPLDDTSIIGRAASIGQPVIIDDVHELPPDAGVPIPSELDRQGTYRMRSMLIVPMIDHRDQLVGVLVLINRKSDPAARITNRLDADRYVLTYTGREMHLARSLAGQAAVSIENARLYAQIERTLTSLVKSAVTAIDQRDPTMAGHSVRVAALTTDLANAVQRAGRGSYRDVRFTREQMRELRFAALLHDIGKLAVHEDVLVKAKKVPPALWERIDARFDLIRRTMEVDYLRERATIVCSRLEAARQTNRLEAAFAEQLEQVQHFQNVVHAANEPTVLPQSSVEELLEIARRTFVRPDRSVMPYLTPDELHYLEIPQGTLDGRERVEVESHAEATYRFLIEIAWTEDLKRVATYAYDHHEKLDGTGYPRRLKGEDIPVQSRIIAIADIFDALTESDRPYKAAVPAEKALDILRFEANAGRLDTELVQILVDSQVYRRILEEDWHQF